MYLCATAFLAISALFCCETNILISLLCLSLQPLPLAILIPAPGILLLYGSKAFALKIWIEPNKKCSLVPHKPRPGEFNRQLKLWLKMFT